MKNILILLSTYNGHRFLRDQLDSLYAQEDVHFHILVRDDGSSDDTVSILNEYKSKYGNMSILAETNVGCVKSFHSLIHIAATKYPSYDYYAFCDQDDIWLPNKLIIGTNKLNKISSSNKLYFCTANYVDTNLKFIRKTNSPKFVDYKTCVFRNPVLGCTMIFDKDFLIIIDKDYDKRMNNSGPIQLHDRWAYQCANYLDTTIINDSEAYINYRQHRDNVTTANKNFFKRYTEALRENFKYRNKNLMLNLNFYNTYYEFINDKKKKDFIQSLCTYNKSLNKSIKYLKNQQWKGESKIDKFLWSTLVLLRLF